MVKTYDEYMRLLEEAIVRNGKKVLSSSQIHTFISKNGLDKDWNIVPWEVKRDSLRIVDRYEKSFNYNGTHVPTRPKKKKVSTYEEYKRLLKSAIIGNGNKPLDVYQIRGFISANDLKRDWDISVKDVEIDVRTICSGLQNPSRNTLNATEKKRSGKKHTGDKTEKKKQTNDNTAKSIGKSKVKVIDITLEDMDYAKEINEVFDIYPDIKHDCVRWKGALSDVFSGNKIEINLLSSLVEGGILGAIEKAETIGKFFIDRFVDYLVQNYGTNEEIARRMVAIWIYGYGVIHLAKEIDRV